MTHLSARAVAPAGLDRAALVCLVASMLLGVAGQVALKASAHELLAQPADGIRPLHIVAIILTSPRILAALALYLSGTLFWLLALARTDLSVLYPYTALNFVLILAPSVWLLHETIGRARLAGVLLIALGVGVHALAGRRDAARAAARPGERRPEALPLPPLAAAPAGPAAPAPALASAPVAVAVATPALAPAAGRDDARGHDGSGGET